MAKHLISLIFWTTFVTSAYFGLYKESQGAQNILTVLAIIMLFANISIFTKKGRERIFKIKLTFFSYLKYIVAIMIGLAMIYNSWFIIGSLLFVTELTDLALRIENGTEADTETEK